MDRLDDSTEFAPCAICGDEDGAIEIACPADSSLRPYVGQFLCPDCIETLVSARLSVVVELGKRVRP